MKLIDLKKHTEAIMVGDIAIPSNDLYIPLLTQALNDIAHNAYCLSLLTQDTEEDILRSLGNGYYIRRPLAPTSDTDDVDIDEDLQYAASNFIASYISSIKPMFYDNKAESIIHDYNYKVVNARVDCKDDL